MWHIRFMSSPSSISDQQSSRHKKTTRRCSAKPREPNYGTACGLLPLDWLPACQLLQDVGSEMLIATVLFLLKPERLEANPKCLRSVAH